MARVLSAASVRAEMLRRGLTPMRCESSKPGRATGYQCGACSNKSKQHDASDTKPPFHLVVPWQVKRGRKAGAASVDKFRGVAFANVRRDSCCECLCRAARFCFLMLACQAAKRLPTISTTSSQFQDSRLRGAVGMTTSVLRAMKSWQARLNRLQVQHGTAKQSNRC